MTGPQNEDAEREAAVAQYEKRLADINRLSVPEAREKVLELLTDSSRITCVPATAPLDSSYDFLAPELHAFFTRFESVTTTRLWNAKATDFEGYRNVHGYIDSAAISNEFTFERALIRPVGGEPIVMGFREDIWTDWWHIGEAFVGSEYVVIKMGDEDIFEGDVYDGPDRIERIARTIYHWILWFDLSYYQNRQTADSQYH